MWRILLAISFFRFQYSFPIFNFREAERIVSWYLRGHPNDDPHRFTPSGDIYSYFQRRPPFPIKFTYPLVNDMKTALGGPSRKLALHRREWMMHYYPSAKDMDPSFTPIRVVAVVKLQSKGPRSFVATNCS
jgi:hypothetical protein